MTFSTLASPGVSLQGGGGSSGGGGGTPGGSNTQIQYNSSGTFAGASGLTTNGTELTIASGTKTADAPVLNMSQTWNNGAVTFTGLKFNATDTASAGGSLLMDLQVGTASQFSVSKTGALQLKSGGSLQVYLQGRAGFALTAYSSGGVGMLDAQLAGVSVRNVGFYSFSSSSDASAGGDTFLSRRAAANLRLGAADAAAPVAQTLSVQSVVAGTTNTAGANFTITGSQGTGTGAGGSIIFQVAPAGSTGSAQNALATALTITSNRNATFANDVTSGNDFLSARWVRDTSASYLLRGEGIVTNVNGYFSFSNGTNVIGNPGDVFLYRDAANTLALRNGTNAQTFRVYNTYTTSTNYEAFKIDWITTANTVLVGTEKGSGGGTARTMVLQTDGTTRLTIPSNGGVWTTSGEYFHFRASANTSASVLSPADGVMTLGNWNADNFNRLQFGGTTSSFPALKRSSTTLQARLADDSAFASVQGKITTDTAYTAGDPATTGYLVVYDSTGTAYKIPALAV